MRFYGSARETYDVDYAARAIDIDKIISIMYENGFRIATKIIRNRVLWAKTGRVASRFVEEGKKGALNFSITDGQGKIMESIDFVIENPIPFPFLTRDATRGNPPVASIDHLIRMKTKRLKEGKGSDSDRMDLVFLKGLKKKKGR